MDLGSLPKDAEPPARVWERISTVVADKVGLQATDEEWVPDDFVRQLGEAVALRHVERVGELLGPYIPAIALLNPLQRNTARLLSYFAQWVDMGFFHMTAGNLVGDHLEHLKRALSRIPKRERGQLTVQTSGFLRFCEGAAALLEEKFDEAVTNLQVVVGLEEEIFDPDITAVTNWLLGRAHIRKGEYDPGFQYIARAQEIARKAERWALVAVAQVNEGWLRFQRGEHESAIRVLEDAKLVLSRVGDHRNLGVIAASLGRIAKRDGYYGVALDHFDDAYKEYGYGSCPNPDQARALERKAFLKYLMSRRYPIIVETPRPGLQASLKHLVSGLCTPDDRNKVKLCSEAIEHLDEAESIYRQIRHRIGQGLVHLTRTFLFIRDRELQRAEEEVTEAYRLGQQNSHAILMARARVLQCKIEIVRANQKRDNDTPGYHLDRALTFAEEAIRHASRTQNSRLLAKAHIWRGLTLVSDYFGRLEEARRCYEEADRLLQPKGGDNVREHFDMLRSRLAQLSRTPVSVAP